MMHEAPMASLPVECDKMVLMPAQVAPAPPQPAPDPAQLRAMEALFAAREKESSQAAGLIGLWAGTVMLNDLGMEMAARNAQEEEDPPPRPRAKDED
jgi:hypothetical protein